jgi:hypothetical protein
MGCGSSQLVHFDDQSGKVIVDGPIQFRWAMWRGPSGAMRQLYCIWVYSIGGKAVNKWMVAKTYMNVPDANNNLWIEQDAIWQSYCKRLALEFNSMSPPKQVRFLQPYIMTVSGRAFLVEDYVEGTFQKWTNNWEFHANTNNTPVAFSHWTLQKSIGFELVCDIQGWTDGSSFIFTDPQIHSALGGHMVGDLGREGMKAFIQVHKCNSLCTSFGLSNISDTKFTTKMPMLLQQVILSYGSLMEIATNGGTAPMAKL